MCPPVVVTLVLKRGALVNCCPLTQAGTLCLLSSRLRGVRRDSERYFLWAEGAEDGVRARARSQGCRAGPPSCR